MDADRFKEQKWERENLSGFARPDSLKVPGLHLHFSHFLKHIPNT